jgi:type II secretion system protein H
MRAKAQPWSEGGFTLIELMVVIAIIGISAAITFPLLNDVSRNATTRAAARELYSHFQLAKIEAVKRNTSVGIIFSAVAPYQYQTFVDTNSDGVLDTTELILSTTSPPKDHTLTNNNANAPGFSSQGRSYGTPASVEIKNSTTGRSFQLKTTIAGIVQLD